MSDHPYAIRLTRRVSNEPELQAVGLGASAAAGVYSGDRLQFNPNGAISVRRGDGWFGIKPGEFEWVSEPHPVWRADGQPLGEFERVPRLIELHDEAMRLRNALKRAHHEGLAIMSNGTDTWAIAPEQMSRADKWSADNGDVLYDTSKPEVGATPEQAEKPLTLDDIGARVSAWRLYNFGQQSDVRHALQICEEAGEVARAVGKEEEGIRPATRGNLADELADTLLSVCGLATKKGIDLDVVVQQRLARMDSLDFTQSPDGVAADETWTVQQRRSMCTDCSHSGGEGFAKCTLAEKEPGDLAHAVTEWRAVIDANIDPTAGCPANDAIPF